MKTGIAHILLFTTALVFISNSGMGQCANCTTQWPPGTSSTTSATLSNVSTCMFGGDYAIFNVTAGETYTWTTCGGGTWDTQLTLFANGAPGCQGGSLAFNNDACGLQSTITWTATFSGTVNVLVSLYNCTNNTQCMTLQWACTSCAGGGCSAVAPYPPSDPCYQQVIAADPFCCDSQWDVFCQNDYNAICDDSGDSNQDCIDGVTVCSDATFSGNSSGSGAVNDLNPSNDGCLNGENQSSWYLFSPETDGQIGFTISPGSGVDYDFAVWGPYPEGSTAADICPPLGAPIRCSYASGPSTNNQTGSYDTGIGHPVHSSQTSAPPPASITFTNQCENPGGCTFSVCLYDSWGDGWDVASLTVQVNAVNVLTNITLPNGTGPLCYNFNVPQNGTITINYTPGNWPAENTYAVFDQANGAGNALLQFDSPNNIHSEPPSGNGWVAGLDVTAGEVYILVIDNFSSNSTPFNLNWNLQNGASLDCTPLPVELLELTGKREGDHNVLRWKTASETNADYFEIQRSDNGVDYRPIGTVNAAGFSSNTQSYVYRDEFPESISFYYRLKQVDFDGAFEYLGPVFINNQAKLPQFGKPYPNPTENGVTQIDVNFPYTTQLTSTVLDALGRPMTQNNHSIARGAQPIRLDLSALAPGIYYVRFSDDSGIVHVAHVIR
jgi:hypothetical protein